MSDNYLATMRFLWQDIDPMNKTPRALFVQLKQDFGEEAPVAALKNYIAQRQRGEVSKQMSKLRPHEIRQYLKPACETWLMRNGQEDESTDLPKAPAPSSTCSCHSGWDVDNTLYRPCLRCELGQLEYWAMRGLYPNIDNPFKSRFASTPDEDNK